MAYGIEAKPTVYKGIKFRSRLEARWAAMFDQLGWTWEYEPEIDGAYIPDFLLHGTGDRRVYVEVKPLEIFLADPSRVSRKAEAALRGSGLLVVGNQFIDSICLGCASIGYFSDFIETDSFRAVDDWDQANLFRPGARGYGLEYDFGGDYGSWHGRLTGAYDGNALYEGSLLSKADLLHLWSKAGNAIQWMPRKPIGDRGPLND